MSGCSRWARRCAAGAVAVVLGLSLTACGGSSDEPSAAATSKAAATPSDGYPFDTSDQGDDLLAPEVKTSDFGGATPVSWRFPTFYADGESDETSTYVKRDDVLYTVLVQAGIGTTPRAAAEELADKTGASAIHDVKLGGRDWVAVVDESDSGSRVTLYGTLPGGTVIGSTFTADVPLADVPPERIAELHQTLLSIRPEPAAG